MTTDNICVDFDDDLELDINTYNMFIRKNELLKI